MKGKARNGKVRRPSKKMKEMTMTEFVSYNRSKKKNFDIEKTSRIGPRPANDSYELGPSFYQRLAEDMKDLNLEPAVVLKESDIDKYALDYFRTKMRGGDYELVNHVSTCPVELNGWYGYHINFFARLKDTDCAPELFFASLNDDFEVEECCILNPRPFSVGESRPDEKKAV